MSGPYFDVALDAASLWQAVLVVVAFLAGAWAYRVVTLALALRRMRRLVRHFEEHGFLSADEARRRGQ